MSMISRNENVGTLRWFNVGPLTDEVIRTRNTSLSLLIEYLQCTTKPQFKGVVKHYDSCSSLSVGIKMVLRMSLQIVAVKRRHGLQQASLRIGTRVHRLLPSTYVVGWAEKSICTPSTYPLLQLYHLAPQSRAGLVSETLNKVFSVDPALQFSLYWHW
jgi:hypothetical protein